MLSLNPMNNKGRSMSGRAFVLHRSSFVKKAGDRTPDSVFIPPSLSARGAGRSWPGGRYPPSPSRRRCERARWYKRLAAPTRWAGPTHLAPHRPAQSPSRRHRCRRWESLTLPFHPSPVPEGHRRVCSLLPSCVVAPFPAPRPRLLFREVAFPGRMKD